MYLCTSYFVIFYISSNNEIKKGKQIKSNYFIYYILVKNIHNSYTPT